jgi:LysR family transcriptional regulator, low CO2-responsive transcriptional regulator
VAVTLTQLRAFVAVARTGSVSGAAEELFVTQPSVSAAVSSLARELGVELTDRLGRRVRVTEAGEAFLPFAVDVLGLLEQGRRAAVEAVEQQRRSLRIAAVTTAGEFVVPELLGEFTARHPEIDVALEVGNRAHVFRLVLDREADVGIGGRPPEAAGLVGRRFRENPIVLVTSPEDRLSRRRSVPVEELAGRTWLLREEGSGTRLMVEEFLQRHELRPRALTLGSNGAIKAAARLGLGVSLQSRVAVELELATGLLATISLRGGLPVRHWYTLRPAAGSLRSPLEQFLRFVHS